MGLGNSRVTRSFVFAFILFYSSLGIMSAEAAKKKPIKRSIDDISCASAVTGQEVDVKALEKQVLEDPEQGLAILHKAHLSDTVVFGIYKKLAEKLPQGSDTIARHITDSNLSEERKIEIFCIRWDLNHGNSDEHVDFFNHYGFQNPNAFFLILKRYAENNPVSFLNEFDDDIASLTREQKLALGAVLAKETQLDESPWIDKLGLESSRDRARILGHVVTRVVNDWGWQDDFMESFLPGGENWFHISPSNSEAVALFAFKNVRMEKLKQREKRLLFLEKWVGSQPSEAFKTELNAILFQRTPLHAIAESVGVADPNVLPLTSTGTELSLASMLDRFAETNPQKLHQGTSRLLTDRMQDRDIFTRLLEGYVKVQARSPGKEIHSSEDIIGELSGLPHDTISGAQWHAPLSVVYKLWLDLELQVGEPTFAGLNLSEENFRDGTALLHFVQSLRDYLCIIQNRTRWSELKTTLFANNVNLSQNDLRRASAWLNRELVSEVRVALGKSGTEITADSLRLLEEDWEGLEPLYTLIARYNAKKEWRPEIPVMAAIASSSMSQRFPDFKFDLKTEPLAFLRNQTQLDAWKKPRAKILSLEKPTKATPVEDSGPVLHQVIELLSGGSGSTLHSEESERLVADVLGNEILKSNPDAIVKRELESHGSQDLWNLCSLTLRTHERGASGYGAVRFQRTLLRLHPELASETTRPVLIERFKLLEKLLQPKRQATGAGVLLSVLNADPKWLMTVGDLVQTSSCVNYRTGGKIGALPGYVIDGNVQVLATFHLKQDDFQNFEDFQATVEASRANAIESISFNGNRRKARITIGGRTFETKALLNAYLRQIAKLGENLNGSGPGVRLEKEYFQDHPALPQMRELHAAIYHELVTELGASPTAPIRFPKTRNPGGIYSDLADDKGTQHSEYIIH